MDNLLSMNRIKGVVERYLDLLVTDIAINPNTGRVIIETFIKDKTDTNCSSSLIEEDKDDV